MHGSIQPFSWLSHLVKLRMKSHEGFLDNVFGGAALIRQTQSVIQEGRFQSLEELFDRFRPGRLGAGLVWSYHGHSLWIPALARIIPPTPRMGRWRTSSRL